MDPKFIVNLSGKDYPTYPGILAEAHERGLRAIRTAVVQIPGDGNGHTAIVKASVELADPTGDGENLIFEAYGDANPKNVNARIATALLRMAETRAKGRALRDACNIGQTMLEELPGDEEQPGKERAREAVAKAETQSRYGAEADAAVTDAAARGRERMAEGPQTGAAGCEVCGQVLTAGQATVSKRNFSGKLLCPTHQREALAAQKGQVAA